MPTSAMRVGALELPLAPGTSNSAIDDPLVSGVLAYMAFCLKERLDAKLANLNGTSADALPTTNRFPWDPEGYFVRGHQDGAISPFPALYVWRRGKSVREELSLVVEARRQVLGVLYVFEELVLPGALEDRYGLRSAVDAVFHDAIANGEHPGYGHNGAPLGTPLKTSLQLAGWGLQYEGGEEGLMAAVPGQSQALGRGSEGHALHAYPTLMGTLVAWEKIGQREPRDPQDVTPGLTATISIPGAGNLPDPLQLFQRVLASPDGSEQPGT
jgi:hypothetical protein